MKKKKKMHGYENCLKNITNIEVARK